MKKALVVLMVLVVAAGAFLYFPRGSAIDALNAAVLGVLKGDVAASRAGSEFRAALDGDVFATGDVVRASDSGLGLLAFFDGSTVSVDPKAQVRVAALARTGSGALQVQLEQTAGRTWSSVTKPLASDSKFEIKTPSMVAAVRGTLFETIVETRPDGTVVTTIRAFEGEVLVQAIGGGQVVVGAGQQVAIAGNEPAPSAPQQQPPTPRLRLSVPAGVGLTAIDPRGWQCGSVGTALVRQSPRCDASGGAGRTVVFGEVVAGTYTLILTAAQAVGDAAIVGEGLGLQGTDFTVRSTRAFNVGDLVRTTLTIAIGADGKLSSTGFTPPELVSSVCGAEAAGRIFASGTLTARADALVSLAKGSKGAPAALVYTQADLTGAVAEAGGSLPLTLSNASVTVDNAGAHLTADVGLGPLNVATRGDVIAGADGGRLVIKMRAIEAGPLPSFVRDQLLGAFDRAFAEFADSIPLNIERVAFRSGCIALIGKTPN